MLAAKYIDLNKLLLKITGGTKIFFYRKYLY